ncbi:hypothetical protein E2C01_007248 [Portunus trituberculatus]|uniref:Uncharacterized protein n=1 Tax=Portunus trituberculatus TaxID=210409 RepID=A0A5B7CYG6_PORTR|nr:hypothetical protein [Portunus trituberculatus]
MSIAAPARPEVSHAPVSRGQQDEAPRCHQCSAMYLARKFSDRQGGRASGAGEGGGVHHRQRPHLSERQPHSPALTYANIKTNNYFVKLRGSYNVISVSRHENAWDEARLLRPDATEGDGDGEADSGLAVLLS